MGPTSSRSLEPSLSYSLDLVQTWLTASSDPYQPFWFKKYVYTSNAEGVDLDVDYRDYAAAIVGFNSGYYDVDEGSSYQQMRVYLEKNTSTFKWKLYARDEGESSSWPEFTVWVMYIDMPLVGDMVNY